MNELSPLGMLVLGYCNDCDEDYQICVHNNKCKMYDEEKEDSEE